MTLPEKTRSAFLHFSHSVRKFTKVIRLSYEAITTLCCPFQSREARALGDLGSSRLNLLPFFLKVWASPKDADIFSLPVPLALGLI